MITLKAIFPAAIALSLCLASPSQAATLNPGGLIFPTGTTSAADPDLAGSVVQDDLEQFGAIVPPGLSYYALGNVQDRVVRSATTGDLVFNLRLRDMTSTYKADSIRITGMELGNFAAYGLFDTDVDFRVDGDGDKGLLSANRSGDGDRLSFVFDPIFISGLFQVPSEESLFVSIKTDATHWVNEGRLTIFGVDNETGERFQTSIGGIAIPTIAAIPLPAPAGLLLFGMVSLGFSRRRGRR